MKLRLVLPDGAEVPAAMPAPGASCAEIPTPCPGCGATPLRTRGAAPHVEDDRRWVARASCAACGAAVGRLVVEADTIFGIEEDARVLAGRCRVY